MPQPAQTERDQEQKRWVTPLRKAQRTTIFCRKATLQGFGDCCFVWLLFSLGSSSSSSLFFFSSPRHKGKQLAARSWTGMTLEMKNGWKISGWNEEWLALLAWGGQSGKSPELCFAIVPMFLQCCPWKRARGGIAAWACQGEGYMEQTTQFEGFASVPLLHCFC